MDGIALSGNRGPQVPAAATDAGRQQIAAKHNVPDFSYEPGYGDQQDDSRRANLLRYLNIIRKHRWLVLAVAGVVFAGGALFTVLATPIYRSAATIQIDREAAKVVQVEGVQAVEANDASFYATQYELLKSRAVASRVVAELNLTEDVRFLRAGVLSASTKLRQLVFGQTGADEGQNGAQPGGLEQASASLLDRVTGELSSAWAKVRRLGAIDAAANAGTDINTFGDFQSRQGIATERVLGGLTVQPIGTSRVVRIAFESPDPQVAAQIANATAQSFIQATLDRRYDASSYAREFLQERLQEIRLKLEESEKQLVQYAQDQQIVSLDGGSSIAQADLAKASAALAEATNERLKAEQLWTQARITSGLALPQILESKAIESIRDRRAQLAAEYEQGLNTFQPAFPSMQKLKAQMDELDRQIQAEVSHVKGSLESKYLVARKQEESLRKYLDSLKKDVLDFERRNVQYKIIRRDVDTNLSLYEGLLQRYKEVGVAGGVGTSNVSIVDRARVPDSPFKPDMTKNLALALGLGLFLGVAAAFGREFFDDALRLAEDVESALGIAVLGVTPWEGSLKRGKNSLHDPHSALAEAFRSLRTALQFSTDEGVPKSLLVTSPRPSEGKSTVSLALAQSFSQLGLRVLLIDADLRDPSLHKDLQRGPALVRVSGLSNYLAGSASPPDILQPTEFKNLTFLPTGPLPPNPAELLAGPKLPSLLRTAEESFDIVIIDGPPVMGLADAPLLASVSAGTLLVLAANQSRRSASKAALKRLQFARAHIVGAVLNKFDHRKAGFTYEYGYGESNYYGYGGDGVAKLSDGRAA